eukprot:119235-Lingulodinium_polyedra.AAC.1
MLNWLAKLEQLMQANGWTTSPRTTSPICARPLNLSRVLRHTNRQKLFSRLIPIGSVSCPFQAHVHSLSMH